MMKRIGWMSVLLLLAGCDSYNPIRLANETNDTLSVKAQRTIHFQADVHATTLSGDYRQSWILFEVPPNTIVDCGAAINGIENEIPFTDLVLTKANGDSIVAHGEKEVLDLFDRGAFGGLETPFVIRIK